MPNPVQTNFTAGVFSPLMHGRFDFAKYFSAAKTLRNMIVLPQGGAQSRGSPRYVNEVKTSSKEVKLMPFIFNRADAYVLEFGDQYMRVYRNRGVVLNGGSPYEISTPFLEAQLFEIQRAQMADNLFLANWNHHPQTVTRTGHTSWTIGNTSFSNSPSGFCGGAGEYPRALTFHQSRLHWGGSVNDPDKIWGSKLNDFLNMDQGTALDDEGTEFRLADNLGGIILHLASLNGRMLAFTSESENVITGGGTLEAITPTNVVNTPETYWGCHTVRPAVADRSILYWQDGGQVLRELAFKVEDDGYRAPDLIILSEHLIASGIQIKDTAFQKKPFPILWACTTDGALLSLTYLREQNVIAWSDHVIGGADSAVESLAVIPTPDGTRDDLWMVVKRTISGGTKRYVEWLDPDLEVDSGLSYSGSPASVFAGLDHLEGESVQVIADGGQVANQVVSSGQIELPDDLSASEVDIGLGWEGEIETLPLNFKDEQGNSVFGVHRGWETCAVQFYQTRAAKIQGQEVSFRGPETAQGVSTPAQNVVKKVSLTEINEDGSLSVTRHRPFKMTVLAIGGEMDFTEV